MESPKFLVVKFTNAARLCQALCVCLRSAETFSQIAARRPVSFEYGVPSRIEDDELLNLVMPQPETFEYPEERRLFYVALTRASRGVFLLMNGRQPSRFIHELARIAGSNFRLETIEGEALPQCPTCHIGQLVEIK